MDKKKKPNYFLRVTLVLFIIFIMIYIIGQTGYYETSVRKDVMLTEEKINEFEEDVLNGEQVDLNTYIVKEDKDYSNALTTAGEGLNNTIMKIFSEGLDEVINIFDILF